MDKQINIQNFNFARCDKCTYIKNKLAEATDKKKHLRIMTKRDKHLSKQK